MLQRYVCGRGLGFYAKCEAFWLSVYLAPFQTFKFSAKLGINYLQCGGTAGGDARILFKSGLC